MRPVKQDYKEVLQMCERGLFNDAEGEFDIRTHDKEMRDRDFLVIYINEPGLLGFGGLQKFFKVHGIKATDYYFNRRYGELALRLEGGRRK